ncbi:CYFA0S01e10616g1_1 [Cyberlindnera fabianii]|uniref:CYFA0S01e10616g1_1 n=1 Tax=Cyberlindnera fabianii TaxID=36022 RepID=A0A061ARU9_CYBFA|nr:Ubiquitin-like-specific protease 1 [Cyberlindnera fabianii]CDR37433.1 CYFA0S01e10616g1_1 [Cyberlindnera fabianii]
MSVLQTPVIIRKRKYQLGTSSRAGTPQISRNNSLSSVGSPSSLPKVRSLDPRFINRSKSSGHDWTKNGSTTDATQREADGISSGLKAKLNSAMKVVSGAFTGRRNVTNVNTTSDSNITVSSSQEPVKKRKVDPKPDKFKTPAKLPKRSLTHELENLSFNPQKDHIDVAFAQSPISWNVKDIKKPEVSSIDESDYGTTFKSKTRKNKHSSNIHAEHIQQVYKGNYKPSPSPRNTPPPTSGKSDSISLVKRIIALSHDISSFWADDKKAVNIRKIPDLTITKIQPVPPPTRSSFRFDHTNMTFNDDFNYYSQKLKERQRENERIHKELLEQSKAKSSLIPTLEESQIDEVLDVWRSRGKDEKLLVTLKTVDVRVHDLKSLGDGRWLNDTVIEAYGKTLDSDTVHFFTPFFFTNLETKGYQSVSRWMKRAKKQLPNLNKILCPINIGGTHWVFGAIDLKNKKLYYMDSLVNHPTAHATRSLDLLEEYIKKEAEKQGCPELGQGYEKIHITECPQQPNGYDCGVFTLLNALHFSIGNELTYDPSESKHFRRVISYTILHYND